MILLRFIRVKKVYFMFFHPSIYTYSPADNYKEIYSGYLYNFHFVDLLYIYIQLSHREKYIHNARDFFVVSCRIYINRIKPHVST